MKFILILSLILTFAINAQNPNPEINYEKPEIRRNPNPLGDNFNPRIDMVNAPSSVKREYVQNYKERNKLRSEIARGFDLGALKQWIFHLGKLNLNMITSQAFINDVSSMKGYAKSLEAFINDRYKNVLNQLALIDLKLKEISVIDEEIENVQNLEPHHLEHPYWKERLNEIIANSASVNNNFNVGIHGIKSVIQKLNTYLEHLEQTYIDPKTLDYSLEDSLAAQQRDQVEEENIPSVSTYISYAGQWLRVNIKPIISDYLIVDGSERSNNVSRKEVTDIAQQVQNIALKNLNNKEVVEKIKEIVSDDQIKVEEANSQIAELVTQTVEEAIQKVNNKKSNNVKVDVEGVAEEVEEKVNQKLDEVTEEEAAAKDEEQHDEDASAEEEHHNNNHKNNNKRNNKKNNSADHGQEESAEPSEESASAEEEHHNNNHKNNNKKNNKKNNNKKNNNKKNNSANHQEDETAEPTEEQNEAAPSEEHDEAAPAEEEKKNNNHKNNNKKNNADAQAESETDAPAETPAAAADDTEGEKAKEDASAEENKNNNKNKKKNNNNKKNKARLRYY